MSEQTPPATHNQAPNAEAIDRVSNIRSNYEATMAAYFGESVDNFNHGVEMTLTQKPWDEVRKTDQFTTTAANLNRLTNELSANPDSQPQAVEQTYLNAVESFTWAVDSKQQLHPKATETLEKLDSLATSAQGREQVASLFHDMAAKRSEQIRDTSLTATQRYAIKREQDELDDFGIAFSTMDTLTIDFDPNNNALEAANDYFEYGITGDTTIQGSEQAVAQSIRHNAFYAKYAAELAESVSLVG
jgi:hypothetical protein